MKIKNKPEIIPEDEITEKMVEVSPETETSLMAKLEKTKREIENKIDFLHQKRVEKEFREQAEKVRLESERIENAKTQQVFEMVKPLVEKIKTEMGEESNNPEFLLWVICTMMLFEKDHVINSYLNSGNILRIMKALKNK